jgi:hypothetical protein
MIDSELTHRVDSSFKIDREAEFPEHNIQYLNSLPEANTNTPPNTIIATIKSQSRRL